VKLVGIIQGRKGPLALVEAPDGLGYILKVDDVLGDGRVTEIGSGTVTFAVIGRAGQKPATVTLRLSLE
jgi:Tfp pilus assembly protein PilP